MTSRFDIENKPLMNQGLGIYTTPPSSPRQRFTPSKPANAPDSPSNSHVARLRAQYDSPPVIPLTTSNLAHLHNVPSNAEKPVVVRAKVTAGAVSKRKPLLPGAERAEPALSKLSTPARPVQILRSPVLPDFVQHEPYEAPPASASKDAVVVCVRIKPVEEDTVWNVDPRLSKLSLTEGERAGTEFRFDGVITGSGNTSIYRSAAKDLIRASMEGFDSVIFAYGQTASGKTFTLSGSRSNPGIIPQAVSDIFAYIRAHPNQEFLLRASYLEIYNEQLKDLLSPETQGLVKIRQDEQKRFFVSPLREEVVTSEAQVAALLLRGEANRHTGSTDYNARSSRSHTVFQMIIESRQATGESTDLAKSVAGKVITPNMSKLAQMGGGAVNISRLSLIDLAGSEKATSQQERRVEGAFINKSLLTLEKVVSALTEDKPRAHIPYRDSKLTQILQPSLSGTAKVAVICTINPSRNSLEESKSTLKFATRVKKVVVAAERNEILDDKALLNKYRAQIAELQAELARKTAEAASIPPTPQRAPDDRRSSKMSSDMKRQAELLKHQITSLETLFLTSSNVDTEREDAAPVQVAATLQDDKKQEDLMEQLLDANEKISDLEDQVLRLTNELSSAKDELLLRPAISPDAPKDVKDSKIASLEKMVRELECVLEHNDIEEAVKRERRLMEREYLSRLRALERDILVRKELEAKANEVLASERKKAKELERFIIQHLNSEADRLLRRRSSLAESQHRPSADLPSLLDEEADLDHVMAQFKLASVMDFQSILQGAQDEDRLEAIAEDY